MPKATELVAGEKFHRLTVLYRGENSPSGKVRYVCRCDCGVETLVLVACLKRGSTKSCGCWHSEATAITGRGNRTHGHRAITSPTYSSWRSMHGRCKESHKSHKTYFDRGVTICERWLSFDLFLADMGERPSLAHTLDRINNDAGYEPGNCRWATHKEQQRNRRSNRREVVFGENLGMSEAAEKYGINRSTFRNHVYKQGRTYAETINRVRELRGLPPLK